MLLTAALLQPAGAETQLCTLNGRTVNAITGEPLFKVKVTVRKNTCAPYAKVAVSTSTDENGQFQFDNLEPGIYCFLAERAGFLTRGYTDRSPFVKLSPGQRITSPVVELTPQGVITGSIFDENGDPAPGVRVTALRKSDSRNPGAAWAVTNDVGEYRIAPVIPGRYLVRAHVTEPPSPARKEGARQSYVPTFYPGVTHPAAAAAIDVLAGHELAATDFRLQRARVYRIEAKIVGFLPDQLGELRITWKPREPSEWRAFFVEGAGSAVEPAGAFEVAGVQPGSYHLIATKAEGSIPLGRVEVDVANADVTGVVLPLAEPLILSGRVRFEGKEDAGLADTRIWLAGVAFNVPGTPVNADGSFTLNPVPRDTYSIGVDGLPDNAYLKSVRLAHYEVPDRRLDLTQLESAPPMEVILSTKVGTIEGYVRDGDQPARRSWVALVPDPPRPVQDHSFKFATTDLNGRFTIRGVAPGEYKLYAWPDPRHDSVRDPDYLKPFEAAATTISIQQNTTTRAALPLIK